MARIVLEAPVRLIRDRLGGHVYKSYSDGSMLIVRIALPKPGYQPSAAKAAQLERFKQASARYKDVLSDPATRAAYERVLVERGPMARLRALVMGDIMKAPEITELDLSKYHGWPGDTIRVVAQDKVGVVRMGLRIYDQTAGKDLELAEQRPEAGCLFVAAGWVHRTRVLVPAGHTVEVHVEADDLAGNRSVASRALHP